MSKWKFYFYLVSCSLCNLCIEPKSNHNQHFKRTNWIKPVYTLYGRSPSSPPSKLPSLSHHVPAPSKWQSGFFASSNLSRDDLYIIPFIPHSCRPWLPLREHAQHLLPSCCWGVQSLWLSAWASLSCVLYKQTAAAIPPGHLHSASITESVRPLKISGAHCSSHTEWMLDFCH